MLCGGLFGGKIVILFISEQQSRLCEDSKERRSLIGRISKKNPEMKMSV